MHLFTQIVLYTIHNLLLFVVDVPATTAYKLYTFLLTFIVTLVLYFIIVFITMIFV